MHLCGPFIDISGKSPSVVTRPDRHGFTSSAALPAGAGPAVLELDRANILAWAYRSASAFHRSAFSSTPMPGWSVIRTRPATTGVLSRKPPIGANTPG